MPDPRSPQRSQGENDRSRAAEVTSDLDASAQILRRLEAHSDKQSRYQSRGEVARGGMGSILRVWDEDLRRELAMKIVLGPSGNEQPSMHEIPPKLLGRFLEEAQVTGQLDHPGIVPVHELGLDAKGRVYFTMRLVKGRDLKEIIELVHQGDPSWTITRVLWVMRKVCEAMAYAHSKGVIHRDLKPANVMVGRFGEVYVMDWGLARVLGQPDRHDLRLKREETTLSFVESERRADASHSADSVLFTMDGDVVGTPAYMAPEQARGEIERLGPRSDVYAVGAMLYHLLTGEMPFVSPGAKVSQHMVLRWALEGPPRPVSSFGKEIPGELIAICEKAMARNPEQRYADMGELGEDLAAFLEDRVVRAYETGAWAELRKWVRRNRGLALVSIAALVAAVGGLAATVFVEARGRRIANEQRAIAQDNERTANTNFAEAKRQEEIAQRERANVLRLSAFQRLEDLRAEADRLWPATPEKVPDYEEWLRRADELVGGLEPSEDGTDPGYRRQLEILRERALPFSAAEREVALREHPRAAELAALEKKLAALRLAQSVREGKATVSDFPLDPTDLPSDWVRLNDSAGQLTRPERTEFGREAEGLALARAALELVPDQQRVAVLDTLAWACFAVGLDDEALAASEEALATAPEHLATDFEAFLGKLQRAIDGLEGTLGQAAVRALVAEKEDLEAEMLAGGAWRFGSETDLWWHNQLQKLVREIEQFADPDRGVMHGTSQRFGWGIERRLAFARGIEERSRKSPEARALWSRATASIRNRSECPAYGGLELEPVLGLLPVGRDPDSGLWEFVDLATGNPPERDPNGRLELEGNSGLVFVLIPGGTFAMGAQPFDPSDRNYDRDAREDENPVVEITLDPFFLSKYEMTQGQWERLVASNPSKYFAGSLWGGRTIGERNPVERVSWFEAKTQLDRFGYRLPTEAQWEYAARGTTESPWWTGTEKETLAGAANLCDSYAIRHQAPWIADEWLDDGHFVHAPVGSYRPNPFGLHDVYGNVFEWCRDVHARYAEKTSAGEGERITLDADVRVVRGGAFTSSAAKARSSHRESAVPDLQTEFIGLRPMRSLER